MFDRYTDEINSYRMGCRNILIGIGDPLVSVVNQCAASFPLAAVGERTALNEPVPFYG